MKTVAWVITLALTVSPPFGAQTGVAGTWRAESAGASWELVLRADGSRLIGMVGSCASPPVDIREGRIDGNTVRFICRSPNRERTITFTGTVTGDEISFEWEMQNVGGDLPTGERFFSSGAPTRFTARRAPDSMLTSLADQARGVEYAAAVNLLQKDAKVDGTLFVPEKVQRVRAVIVVTNWGVGPNFYGFPEVQKFAESTESALLLARFSNLGPSTVQHRNNFSIDGAAALVQLLERFAQESTHPELVDAPLLFWGYSAGGGGIFAEALAQRTIALVLYHSFLAVKPAGPADLKARSQIPILFIAGEKDTSALAGPLEELWRRGRSLAAPWTFALEPGAPHFSEEHLRKANSLMLPWMAAVLRQRVATSGTALRAISDASGWTGSIQTGETAGPGIFPGAKTDVSWLPDEATAKGWQLVIGKGN